MADIATLIEGSHELVLLFGAWPSFHDAEVVSLDLWRGDVKPGEWDDSNIFPILTIKIRILRATQVATSRCENDVIVTFRFHDVSDFQMIGFNHCNQIVDFLVSSQARGKLTSGIDLQPHLLVKFEPGFGMGASFHCFRIEFAGTENCLED